MDKRTDLFGKLLKQQCEDRFVKMAGVVLRSVFRLAFYEGGGKQAKNVDVMAEAIRVLNSESQKGLPSSKSLSYW